MAKTLPELGLPAAYYIDDQANMVTGQRAVYKVELDIVSSSYSGVRAIPQGRQTGDSKCMTFVLSQLGIKTVSTLTAAFECW